MAKQGIGIENKRKQEGEEEKGQKINTAIRSLSRGARDVIVIVVGNEHGDTSSDPGQDCLHFPLH